MKTIVIGDIHGRDIWKKILERHSDYDRVIFIGDYFDTKQDISPAFQLHNFKEICNLKKDEYDSSVILLVGNHDHHYMAGVEGGNTTGYQPAMRFDFERAISDNIHKLQIAFVDDYKYVYSHAGITYTWLNDMGILTSNIYSQIDIINDLLFYMPRKFSFYENDRSGYGDNIHQSPIWVRPNALYKDGISEIQIVGHTIQPNGIDIGKSVRQKFWLIDALYSKEEYLVIIDGIVGVDNLTIYNPK